VLVKVKATNEGNRALPIDGNDFAVTGASGLVRRFVGAIAPDPALDGTVEPGKSREGWVVLGAAADEQDLLLVYDSVTLTGNWADRVFALAKGATVPAATKAAAKPNKAGASPDQPAGPNEPVVTDEWSVEITDVVSGQDVYNLYPASDYRTTALGDADPGSVANWLAVRVKVTDNRTGGDASYFSPTAFGLAAADGSPIEDILTLTPPNPDVAGTYYPGGTREGWVVFELPGDGSAAMLRFLPFRTEGDARYLSWTGEAPAASAKPTPRAEPIAAGTEVRTTDTVNLRSGPSTDAKIVATLPAGTKLTVTGAPQRADGHEWYPVKNPATGETGYVAGEYLQ
jgi:hypothetical protein